MENNTKNMVTDMLKALKFDVEVNERNLFTYIVGTLFDDGAYKHITVFLSDKGNITTVFGTYNISAAVCCLEYFGELYMAELEKAPLLELMGHTIEDFVNIAATIANA